VSFSRDNTLLPTAKEHRAKRGLSMRGRRLSISSDLFSIESDKRSKLQRSNTTGNINRPALKEAKELKELKEKRKFKLRTKRGDCTIQ
jgi:hypothetical protein